MSTKAIDYNNIYFRMGVMATTKLCRRCGTETHFTKMSMIDYYDLCYPCRKEEDIDGKLIISQIFIDRGYNNNFL